MFPLTITVPHRRLRPDPSRTLPGPRGTHRQTQIARNPPSGLAQQLACWARRLWRQASLARPKFRPAFEGLESREVFSLTPVSPGAPGPFSAIVKIQGRMPDGEIYVGSGVMVDSYHVLTAGHNVYDYDDGGYASSITVIPALSGASKPFGVATMIRAQTTPAWKAFSKSTAGQPDQTCPKAQDIGLITLNRRIGDLTGWMPFGYSKNMRTYARGSVFDTAGYPADPASGYDGQHMAYSSGPITGLLPPGDAIGYAQAAITTYGGQSGSPLWDHSTGVVYGVVTGDGIPAAQGYHLVLSNSKAPMPKATTRITPAIYNYLERLIRADTPPSPSPLSLTATIGPTWHSSRGLTSIGIFFDQPLDPISATQRRQYRVLDTDTSRSWGTGVMDLKTLPIGRVRYDAASHMVRIYLARPDRGSASVIVYPGLVGADGANSTRDFSWEVR
jgi:V8-like Glu-specific endopeptidase